MKAASIKNIFLALLGMMLLSSQTSAFHVPHASCRCSTQHHSLTSLRVAEKKPRWTELPRVRQSRPELSGFEINIGRLAMIGFCGLLAKEVVSGQTFGEQVLQAIMGASGVNLPI